MVDTPATFGFTSEAAQLPTSPPRTMARGDDDDDVDDSSKWPSWWAGWRPVWRAADAVMQMDEKEQFGVKPDW